MLSVHLLPSLTTPEQLAGKTVVVVDVLRATTTICHALAAGATTVIPTMEVDEAVAMASKIEQPVLLGGERQAVRIQGFDLGNSPAEYSSDRVAGQTIVFTTSNGTKAMKQCRLAKEVLLAAFVNLSAVCDQLIESDHLHIVCAGTNNEITREDALFAGALIHQLRTSADDRWNDLNDQAELASEAWCDAVKAMTQQGSLADVLSRSGGGRNLIQAGMESDIDICAQIDRLEIVPRLDLATWQIRA